VSESGRGGSGNIAVITPQSLYQPVLDAFDAASVTVGRAPRDGLARQITVVPVNLVKGLEVDSSVVVEPAAIYDEEPQGARSLYVACTRATKRLMVVHHRPLPAVLVS
jgi:DNA helicase IV